LEDTPGRLEIVGLGIGDGKVIGGLGIQFEEKMTRGCGVAGDGDEAAAARKEVAAGVTQAPCQWATPMRE
jgi:hypothetical protein